MSEPGRHQVDSTAEQGATAKSPNPNPRGRRSPTLALRLVLALGTLLATLICAEVFVRILGLAPAHYEPRRFEPDGRVPFVVDSGGRFFYQPGARFASIYDTAGDDRGYFKPDGRIPYRINNLGLRGPDTAVEKPEGAMRIACLGDSFTFGEGVREQDTYPEQLRKQLSQQFAGRQLEVINAGVQGYGVLEELYLFGVVIEPLKPDVVVLGFVLNDPCETAETIRRNDERVAGIEYSTMGRISAIWSIVENTRQARRREEQFIADTRGCFDSQRWRDTQMALAGMQQYANQHDFRFLVVLFPFLVGLDGDYPFESEHRAVADACKSAGIDFLDLLPALRGRNSESLWVHPTDQHPNEIVHALAARLIADHLMSDGAVKMAP